MNKRQEIPGTQIIALPNGRAISLVTAAGHVADGTEKDGSPRLLAYAEGSPVLHDAYGNFLCGPIDYWGIKAFASDVVSGISPRPSTESGAAMRLATALLAIMSTLEFAGADDLVVPAVSEEVA